MTALTNGRDLRPRNALENVIQRLDCGPWKLIQLRGAPLSANDLDQGDVDFLASPESVGALLQAAFSWTRAGYCHVRVSARDRNKTTLQFISIDGRHRLCLDLWKKLWQIKKGSAYLQYKDCTDLIDYTAGRAITRLPLKAEVALYIYHLRSKRKDLKSSRVQTRIADYLIKCADLHETTLVSVLQQIATESRITPEALRASEEALRTSGLLQRLTPRESFAKEALSRIRTAWLAAPRKCSYVAIMGCDGSGKTSLTRCLLHKYASVSRVYTGKRLYRNSLTYKIAVTMIRPFTGQPRDRFDDHLAPFNYIKASLALEALIQLRRRGMTLIDRSLADFLIVDRKSDRPRWHGASKLASVLGRRIPTVHLLVPHERLVERKHEMTTIGHSVYDSLVFDRLSQQIPTDYTMYFNGGELQQASEAANRLIAYLRNG